MLLSRFLLDLREMHSVADGADARVCTTLTDVQFGGSQLSAVERRIARSPSVRDFVDPTHSNVATVDQYDLSLRV